MYEKIMPGSQLLNRFQDLGYRVKTLSNPRQLAELALQEKPMLVVADTNFEGVDACAAVAELKAAPETTHLPVIAITPAGNTKMETKAKEAGATMVVSDSAILVHLKHLLDQALQID